MKRPVEPNNEQLFKEVKMQNLDNNSSIIQFPQKKDSSCIEADQGYLLPVTTDSVENGVAVRLVKFQCLFYVEGDWNNFEIWAIDRPDAMRKLECLKRTATVGNQVFMHIPR